MHACILATHKKSKTITEMKKGRIFKLETRVDLKFEFYFIIKKYREQRGFTHTRKLHGQLTTVDQGDSASDSAGLASETIRATWKPIIDLDVGQDTQTNMI